jgi:hypothetical protein
VVPVGCIGSTSVLREMLPSGTELPEAVQGLNRWTGTPPAALMPLEMVGVNGLAPLAAGGGGGGGARPPRGGVDGRPTAPRRRPHGTRVPARRQSSLVVSGRAVSPCATAEPDGRTLLFHGVSPSEVKSLLRLAIAHSSDWAALALPPQRAADR